MASQASYADRAAEAALMALRYVETHFVAQQKSGQVDSAKLYKQMFDKFYRAIGMARKDAYEYAVSKVPSYIVLKGEQVTADSIPFGDWETPGFGAAYNHRLEQEMADIYERYNVSESEVKHQLRVAEEQAEAWNVLAHDAETKAAYEAEQARLKKQAYEEFLAEGGYRLPSEERELMRKQLEKEMDAAEAAARQAALDAGRAAAKNKGLLETVWDKIKGLLGIKGAALGALNLAGVAGTIADQLAALLKERNLEQARADIEDSMRIWEEKRKALRFLLADGTVVDGMGNIIEPGSPTASAMLRLLAGDELQKLMQRNIEMKESADRLISGIMAEEDWEILRARLALWAEQGVAIDEIPHQDDVWFTAASLDMLDALKAPDDVAGGSIFSTARAMSK